MANNLPVVTLNDGIPTTLSTDVAATFGKQHKDVLRAIENIIVNLPEDRRRNFALCFENNALANGKPIKRYRLTRDGFTFLAMGFTGEKAQAFKWAYIDAFNRMEAKLHGITRNALPRSRPPNSSRFSRPSHAGRRPPVRTTRRSTGRSRCGFRFRATTNCRVVSSPNV